MAKPNRHDIFIGEDQWIPFIELETPYSDAEDLDVILAPIQPFLDLLETECVADCCGIDAYALWPEAITNAATKSNDLDLAKRIVDVRKQIVESHGNSFVSNRMNNYFAKPTLLQLIDHLAHNMQTGIVGEQSDEREPE